MRQRSFPLIYIYYVKIMINWLSGAGGWIVDKYLQFLSIFECRKGQMFWAVLTVHQCLTRIALTELIWFKLNLQQKSHTQSITWNFHLEWGKDFNDKCTIPADGISEYYWKKYRLSSATFLCMWFVNSDAWRAFFFEWNKIKHANLWKQWWWRLARSHLWGNKIQNKEHWNGLSSLPFLSTTSLFHSFPLFCCNFNVSVDRYQFYVRNSSSILSAVTQPAYISYITCSHLLHSKMWISCKKLL